MSAMGVACYCLHDCCFPGFCPLAGLVGSPRGDAMRVFYTLCCRGEIASGASPGEHSRKINDRLENWHGIIRPGGTWHAVGAGDQERRSLTPPTCGRAKIEAR
jgi:hypothetical protein